MHKTKNDLPLKVRTAVVELLNARLADCVDLQTQVKQAHWNVKGPSFIALHELFDRISGEVSEFADLIAERTAQLGGTPLGTARVAAAKSSLGEYPLNISGGRQHVAALSAALASFGALARKAIDQADRLGDKNTADIFTEVSRGTDKALWFVEAHGQANA
ncbi:MAG: DNA starvation/stationary phase protection protein Dps [Phycisphaeraceae bacterium]|nr:DNA starvation/stationary phase protection protein Dps [Phycisphaeraceae bacterium]